MPTPEEPEPMLIRPVKCHFCNEPMFYSGDERHEPEVSVSINGNSFHFYAHVRCWNQRMKPLKASEEVFTIIHAFGDKERKDAVRRLADRVAALEQFAESCRDNYDCDSDGHRYNTGCRSCEAKELLK